MMRVSKALKGFIEEAKKTDGYWIEAAKLQFAMSLETQRRAANMTYSAIAQKLGTSAAYITKIFRGDSNVTIDSMVKLAHATGGRLDVRIVDKAVEPFQWDISNISGSKPVTFTSASAIIIPFPEAANHSIIAVAA